jgi:FAD synthase
VVVGEFDGMHRTHAGLIAHARTLASDGAGDAGEVVALVVDAGDATAHLMNVRRRCELLVLAGVASATVVRASAQLDAHEEVAAALERLRPGVLLEEPGWGSSAVSPADITTAAIIRHVRRGDVAHAAALLGRPFELEGVFEPSSRDVDGARARFVVIDAQAVVPRSGAYAAHLRTGRRWVGAVVHVGSRRRGRTPIDIEADAVPSDAARQLGVIALLDRWSPALATGTGSG